MFGRAMGTSGCAYAEAPRRESLPDWLARRGRAVKFYAPPPFFSSRSRPTGCLSGWSSDVCSSDLLRCAVPAQSARWFAPMILRYEVVGAGDGVGQGSLEDVDELALKGAQVQISDP